MDTIASLRATLARLRARWDDNPAGMFEDEFYHAQHVGIMLGMELGAAKRERGAIEARLPERVRFWISDAHANGDFIDEAGQEVICALRSRFRWTDDDAVAVVNDLLAAYGSQHSFVSHREMARARR